MVQSSIEWAEMMWNPVTRHIKISLGCKSELKRKFYKETPMVKAV
jgi:protein gp37